MEFNLKVLFAFFVVFVVLDIPSTTAIKEKSLRKICSKTSDKEDCLNLLNYDGRASYVDLHGLTGVALDVALEKLSAAREKLDVLGDGISDNNYDEHSPCSQHFKDAINNIKSAKQHLKSRDYSHINDNIFDALEKIHECKKASLDDQDGVKKIIDDVKLACSVVKITSQKLDKKNHPHKKHTHEEDTYDD